MEKTFTLSNLAFGAVLLLLFTSNNSFGQNASSCSEAVVASTGTNAIPATVLDGYWYTYTIPADGKLVVSSSTDIHVSLSYNTCANRYYAGAGIGNASYASAAEGQEIFIYWDLGSSGGDFEWDLSIVDLEEGDNCSLAKVLAIGENYLPPTYGEYWFTYTMPSDGRFVAQTPDLAGFDIISGDCPANLYGHINAYDNISAAFSEGENIFLRFRVEKGGDFTWSFNVLDLEEGNTCEIAKEVMEGTYENPQETTYEYWYTYTKTTEGKVVIETNPYRSVSAYSNTCENLSYIKGGWGQILLTNVAIDEQIFVKVYPQFDEVVDLTLSVEPLEPGDGCNSTVLAVEGANTLPSTQYREYWYEFVMPGEGKLQISSENNAQVTIYSGACSSLVYETGGSGLVTATGLSSDEKVWIVWNTASYDNFDWELSVEELSPGDNCSLAVIALEGANHAPETTLEYFWYSYTVPSTGRLVIASETGNRVDVMYNSCQLLYGFASGYGGVSRPVFETGTQLFIRWHTSSGGNFDWSISVDDYITGDVCEIPIDAVEGINVRTANGSGQHWYSFVMPSTQKLSVTSSSGYASCSIYSGNCGSLYHKSSGQKGTSATGLEAGEEVVIVWYESNDFNWLLTLEDYVEGDYCEIAQAAADGSNELPATSSQYFWYTYQVPSDGKLVISSLTDKYVEIYSGTCNSRSWQASGYGDLTLPEVSMGDEFIIRWNADPAGFTWDISVQEPQLGDLCSLSQVAVSGTNSVPEISTYYWYSYTINEDKKLSLRSSGDSYVTVYKGSCEFLNQVANGYENIDVAGLAIGDNILIRWDYNNGGDFDWTLGYEDVSAGDLCSLAASAVEGVNTVPDTYAYYYWYSYTMPQDGKLTINSSSYAYLYVYSNSCDELFYKGNSYNGKIDIPSLTEGTQLFVRWAPQYGYGFDWTLGVEESTHGDDCSQSDPAEDGVNHIPTTGLSNFWYSYTAPADGKLTISSNSSTGVSIYTGECGSLIYKGYGNGSAFVTGFAEGDQIYLSWNTSNYSDFDWNLEFVPYETGDFCTDPLAAVEGTNTTDSAPIWFKFTVPAEGDLTISSVGTTTTDTYLRLYQSCGLGSFASNDDFGGTSQSEITVTSLARGEEIWMLWDDSNSIDGFDWTIAFDSNVEPFDQTITFDAISNKTYGSQFDIVATSDSDLDVLVEVISGPAVLDGSLLTLTGLGEVVIEASQTGDYYFNPAVPVQRSFTVNPAPLVVKAANKTITYGDPLPNLTYSISGFVKDETEEVITGTISISTDASEIPNVGTYDIVTSGGEAVNYNISHVKGTLTVEKPSQTLTFDPLPEKTFGDGVLELVAVGGASGNPVAFSSGNTEVATVEGNLLTIAGAGTTTITAYQEGGDNYKDASVERQLIVNKASQSVEFAELTEKIFGDEAFPLSAVSSSGLTVSFSSSNTAVAQIENGILSIKSAGEATITALQPGDGNYNLATATQLLVINKASQAITFSEIGPTVGISNGAITLSATSSSGLGVSYKVMGPASLLGTVLTLTAPGQVEVTATQGGNVNYLPAEDVTIGFEVIDDTNQRAEQTISFSPIEGKTFRDDPFELEATASSGLDIVFTIESGPATIDGSVVTLTGAGSVTIAANQAGDEEYAPASEITQSFLVGKATATIALSNLQQRADGAPKTPTVSIDPPFVDYVIIFDGGSDEPVEPGSYEVVVEVEDTNYQGSASETFVLSEALAVKDGDLDLDVKAYPIPVKDYLTVEMAGSARATQATNKVIRLMNLLGRESHRSSFVGDISTIDLKHQPKGIYLLLIENEMGEVLKRVKVSKE
ncbi:MAG: MBG domain-containing protein [Imperialibacter sp.]|uniref:MBG domain-containing protein n=1 Tax=Imperialibacter sp. TaxID=2038411 RepID=UPI0032EB7C0A